MIKRVKLVSYWHVLWRAWSIRFAAIGTLILSFGALFPVSAYDIWASLPIELRMYIPPIVGNYIGIALYCLSMISQFIRQEKLIEKWKGQSNE